MLLAEPTVVAMLILDDLHTETAAKGREKVGQRILARFWDMRPLRRVDTRQKRQQNAYVKGSLFIQKRVAGRDICARDDLSAHEPLRFKKHVAVRDLAVCSDQRDLF